MPHAGVTIVLDRAAQVRHDDAHMTHTLKAARERAGLGVSELARIIGCNRSTIQRLENGFTLPSHATELALEKALRVRRGGLRFSLTRSVAA